MDATANVLHSDRVQSPWDAASDMAPATSKDGGGAVRPWRPQQAARMSRQGEEE